MNRNCGIRYTCFRVYIYISGNNGNIQLAYTIHQQQRKDINSFKCNNTIYDTVQRSKVQYLPYTGFLVEFLTELYEVAALRQSNGSTGTEWDAKQLNHRWLMGFTCVKPTRFTFSLWRVLLHHIFLWVLNCNVTTLHLLYVTWHHLVY